MTTTTTSSTGPSWRTAMRTMPTLVAAAYLTLLAASVAVMLLALAAGLIGELAERLAVAGWAGARSIHSAYPPAPAGPGDDVGDPAASAPPTDLRRAAG